MFRCTFVLLFVGWASCHSWAQAAATELQKTPPAFPPASQRAPQKPSVPSGAQGVGTAPAESSFPFDRFQEFSAVMVGSPLPKDERESHIYRSGNLLRTEGLLSRAYMVTDLAANQTYAVANSGCMKSSTPFLRAYPFFLPGNGRKIERSAAGKEKMDGHDCQVEDVTISGEGLAVPVIKLRFWDAADLNGFPIRIDIDARRGPVSTIRYKNVVLGPQDETLFLYPNSCQDLAQDKDDDDDAQPAKQPSPPPDAKKPAVNDPQK
jgi:hypothetical protein